MTHLAIIFAAGLVTVFLLGFQSRCVNHGNYWQAACCSFTIAMCQSTLWGALLHNLTWAAAAAYGLSGAMGITASMYVHRRFINKKKKPTSRDLCALAGELIVEARALAKLEKHCP